MERMGPREAGRLASSSLISARVHLEVLTSGDLESRAVDRDIAAQIASSLGVSRGRVSARMCECVHNRTAFEVCLWEVPSDPRNPGFAEGPVTASALASDLIRQVIMTLMNPRHSHGSYNAVNSAEYL